jgi:hypothetical protein
MGKDTSDPYTCQVDLPFTDYTPKIRGKIHLVTNAELDGIRKGHIVMDTQRLCGLDPKIRKAPGLTW